MGLATYGLGGTTTASLSSTVLPVVSNFIPPLPGPIQSTQAVEFDVTISDGTAIANCDVAIGFGGLNTVESVYDGSTFSPFYSGSTVTGITNGLRFHLLRQGGWPGSPRLKVRAVSATGIACASLTFIWDLAVSTFVPVLADPSANAVPGNRDLAFDKRLGRFKLSNGNLTFTQGMEAIRQGIEIRLQFFLGEWFLDTTKGMAYYQQVFVKNPSIPGVRALLREQILSAPGVRNVTSLDLTLDKKTRRMSIKWTADTDLGEITGIASKVL